MRRDSIFYQLFRQSPALLFELLDNPPPSAADYYFDSVAVKEPKFEIDGVFLPPEDPGIVYFCEVQFQKDEQLYERLFAESLLYFYRNRDRFTIWHAVIIYPSRTTEQSQTQPYQPLLDSSLVDRIYLNELGDIDQLPLGTALMVLTTLEESEAPEQARAILARVPQEAATPAKQRGIIEMIATIMVYKFTTLSRLEIDAMLGLALQETRVYQEAREEGRQEGETLGRQEGRQEGQLETLRSLLVLLLTQKFEPLPEVFRSAVLLLPSPQLEALAIALLGFSELAELDDWLTVALRSHLLQQLGERFGELPEAVQLQLQAAPLAKLSALGNAAETMEAIADLVAWWDEVGG